MRKGIGCSPGTQNHVCLCFLLPSLAWQSRPKSDTLLLPLLCPPWECRVNFGEQQRKPLNALSCHHSAPSCWHFSGVKQERSRLFPSVHFPGAALRFPAVQLRKILFLLLNLDSFMKGCCNRCLECFQTDWHQVSNIDQGQLCQQRLRNLNGQFIDDIYNSDRKHISNYHK